MPLLHICNHPTNIDILFIIFPTYERAVKTSKCSGTAGHPNLRLYVSTTVRCSYYHVTRRRREVTCTATIMLLSLKVGSAGDWLYNSLQTRRFFSKIGQIFQDFIKFPKLPAQVRTAPANNYFSKCLLFYLFFRSFICI